MRNTILQAATVDCNEDISSQNAKIGTMLATYIVLGNNSSHERGQKPRETCCCVRDGHKKARVVWAQISMIHLKVKVSIYTEKGYGLSLCCMLINLH